MYDCKRFSVVQRINTNESRVTVIALNSKENSDDDDGSGRCVNKGELGLIHWNLCVLGRSPR